MVAGLAAGLLSGGVGVGGAVVATPLIRALGVSPYLAVGSTVPAILPSTITGALTYLRAGMVNKRVAGLTALTGAVFSVLGAMLTRSFDGHLLMITTAVLLFVLGLRTFPTRGESEPLEPPRPGAIGLLVLGASAGTMSGLLGVGGGFILVPAFIRIFGLPVKVALGTSLSVIAVMTLPSIATHSLLGNIRWDAAIGLALGVIPGARIGAKAALRAQERRLKMWVASVLCAIAVGYAAFEVAALSSSEDEM